MYIYDSKVCILGLGYIGLPTAVVLASSGYKVLGCDINIEAVKKINQGRAHIVEQGLNQILQQTVASKSFVAYTEPKEADVFIIAVPTPFKEQKKPDLKYIEAATRALAPKLRPGNLIILESTSPVGTTQKVAQWINKLRPDLLISNDLNNENENKTVYVAHCPERVLPGYILREIIENDRIIGGIDQASTLKAKKFYQTFVKGQIFLTDARTAEMAKLTENSFRDVNIAFANELSIICDELNIDVRELIKLANYHPRVNILNPGPGVGGHCIAVDPWFIVDAAPEHSRLINTAREVNESKPRYVIETVKKHVLNFDKSPIIACLGLAFKPNIDDLRESPSVFITKELAQQQFGKILVVEPHIKQLPAEITNLQRGVELTDLESALERADIVLFLVAHNHFASFDFHSLKNKVIIDTCGGCRTIMRINHREFEMS